MPTKQKQIKKDRILLPRGYMSWSAMNTFKRNKEEYIRHYFYGEPGYQNRAMEFGKVFAEHLESGDQHADAAVNMVIGALPRLTQREHPLEALLASPWGDIRLVGKLDQYDPKDHAFDEFKSGRRKWTANMAQNHGQMKFYSLMLWIKYGVINQRKQLVWVETEYTDDGIKPTGRIETYPVNLTLVDILNFGKEVIKVAKEISDLYQQHLNQI